MNKTIPQLLGEITSLAVLITQNTKHDVFVDYQAHVNQISVKFYNNGWANYEDPISTEFYLSEEWLTEKDVLNKLVGLKQQLIKIGIKNKLDFSKLPYEIEEVKKYKLI